MIESVNDTGSNQRFVSSGHLENLQLFESLGDNCEFGFVLRELGNHTSSLLRWALLDSVADTARGVRTSFRGAYLFENLKPAGAGQMVRDITQGIAFHTRMRSQEMDGRWEFIAPEDERREIHQQEARKLDYLRQKFDREIAGDQRIYVTKRNEGMSDADAEELLSAIRSRGRCRLLYVTLADTLHPAGTVERVSDELAHGWIDRFSPYDQADDVSLVHWKSLLAATEAMFSSRAAPPVSLAAGRQAGRSGLRATLFHLWRRNPAPAPVQPANVEAKLAATLEAGGFFDAEIYATQFASQFGSFDLGEGPTMAHWLGAGRTARIVPTHRFDESFYLANNPDVAATGGFGFEHFLLHGHDEGRSPLPEDPSQKRLLEPPSTQFQVDELEAKLAVLLEADGFFDSELYASRFGPFASGEGPTLAHWLRVGRAARIVPTNMFDESFYLANNPDVASAGGFGFEHFLLCGRAEGRAPLPDDPGHPRLFGQLPSLLRLDDAEARMAAVLEADGFFDSALYGTQIGSLDFGEGPTVAHWLRAGRAARIVPTHKFNESFYLANNPDVAATGGFGFEHFLLCGHAEGRAPLPHEDPRHQRLFMASFYASQAGIAENDLEALWEHYLVYGLPKDASPSPLFDPAFYKAQIERIGLEPRYDGEALIHHWFRVGANAGVVPTPYFHERFYRAVYPDLAEEPFGFTHYIFYGLREGRLPCPWFEPRFYTLQPGVPPDAGYDHFLAHGLAGGLVPSRAVEHLVQAKGVPLNGDDFAALMDVSVNWDDSASHRAVLMLACLYVPAWHEPAETVLRGFVAYLHAGAMTTPGPLFDPAIYRERAAAAGIPAPSPCESAVLHWVRYGHAARIVPTIRYDEDDYHRLNPDIGSAVWGFEHFVIYGAAEGRSPRQFIAFRRVPAWGKTAADQMFDDWHASDFPSGNDGRPAGLPARYTQRLGELLISGELAQVFARTQRVDPDVGELATISEFLLPPYHDPLEPIHGEILRRLREKTYATVICIPWVRVGGADLVAGLLGRALLRIRPDERVLYLQTDNAHFERASWLPAGADVVDLSDIVRSVTPDVAQHLLRLVLRGVSAKRVFNVNSLLCWTTLRNYGANLALTLNTYSYMFCWDQTPSGLRIGYPAQFFAATAATITAFLTDTSYLRDELSAMYRLPDATRAKIVHLCTPAQTAVRATAIARKVFEQANPASRRLVLWAGRLDRQKRFDLVLDIARLLPEVEFRCWGAAMLEAPPDLSTIPANVTMQGSFDHFDELPLDQAGAWLFTALWEGMPTTLIELATRGVAVVGSAVGGVPELIQADCGWPIPPDARTEDYVKALEHALSDPEEAAKRAEALQRRVATRYNEADYDAALNALLLAETHV